MHIFLQKAKVISEYPLWVCTHGDYLYTAKELGELIDILNTEWEHDKHLA